MAFCLVFFFAVLSARVSFAQTFPTQPPPLPSVLVQGLGFRAEWQTIEPTEPKLVLARPVIFSPVGATEVTVDVQCVACDGLEFSSDLTLLERYDGEAKS